MSHENVEDIPERKDVPVSLKWKLEDIYGSDEMVEADMSIIKFKLPELGAFAGRLGTDGLTLLAGLELKDEIEELASRVFVYTHMRKDEDNANPKYQAMHDRAASLAVEVGSAASFVSPEILAIPEESLERFICDTPGLGLYRQYLHSVARRRAHTLTVAEERIIAMAAEMGHGASTIFSMLNNADVRFPSIVDEGGNSVEVTKGRFIKFMESRDRRVRKDAFDALYSSYRSLLNTISASYSASVKADAFNTRVRKYDSSLAGFLDRDNIPVDVYGNLIDAVRSRLDLMHRYVALRKRSLGLDELHMYDIYVPIIPDIDWKVSYDEAREMVKEGLHPLGEAYGAQLSAGLEMGWVDVAENRGKTSGAYSWGAYGAHPYVLLNWQDTLNNAFTLAHEMGHAMHFHYSWSRQPFVYSDYSIFVAEVASTVNEVLLMEHLLRKTTDPVRRMYLLNHCLEEFRGTVFRQTMFAEFEREAHRMFESGQALTPEAMCEKYIELNRAYYGPEIVHDEAIAAEWARIPHFYNAFYVYQYATGYSAAVALANKIISEGVPARERYIEFLSGGSSKYPIDLLRGAGVDMASPEPVVKALDVFERCLTEMESFFANR
ncbi:MAG: oligoendopeptidase F [Clostridia bacterium]|nr:oligoendopeptidase F [Clostridia bacterium]